MNSSFSKKRHIFEANQRLEKRFLIERIENSLDSILKEQATQNNSQTVNPKDKTWYKKFPCLEKAVGNETLTPKELKDGTYALKERKSENLYLPDGTLYYPNEGFYLNWYCDNNSNIAKSNEFVDNEKYLSAVEKGLAIKFTGDLTTKPKPGTETTQGNTTATVNPKDKTWYKKFPCLKHKFEDADILTMNKLKDGTYALKEIKSKNLYLPDGTLYYPNEDYHVIWFCDPNYPKSIRLAMADYNKEIYLSAVEKGLAINFIGDLENKPAPDTAPTPAPAEPVIPDNTTAPTPAPAEPVIPDNTTAPTPAPAEPVIPDNTTAPTPVEPAPTTSTPEQVITPKSQEMGESGQVSKTKTWLNMYDEIRNTKKLPDEELKNCAAILRYWYDDWTRRVIYPKTDHYKLKAVAQSCAYQADPSTMSRIFGAKGGKVDRDTGKLINLLTGNGVNSVPANDIYRLNKRRG